MRFIDTNLLLRYLTKDDEEKAQKVLNLLKKVEKNEEKVIASSLVIFETIFTLESYYKISRQEIKNLLAPILNLRGLRLQDKEVYQEALDLYTQQKKISFADAFNATFAIKNGVKEIYSYDTDFDKLEQIKRITPK
ncbi:MAG: type II toxin-antitoxin system VapC family toxin [Methanocellales archaeon]|nr:type II toxin-antitoxin system VapC family toxin [Methanocellales archaeon]